MKKFRPVFVVLLTVSMLLVCSYASATSKEDIYREANTLMSDEAYEDAAAKFAELGQYEDAPLLVMYCKSLNAAAIGRYTSAISGFQALGDFRDCEMLMIYYAALSYESAEEYEKAQELLAPILYFKDSNDRILSYGEKVKARDYNAADRLEQKGDLETALIGFRKLGDYSDSTVRVSALQEKIKARDYEQALAAENRGDFATALDGFTALGDYSDSKEHAEALYYKGTYAKAILYADEGWYSKAYQLFVDLGDYEDSQEKAYVLAVSRFATSMSKKGKGIVSFEFHDKTGFINLNTNKVYTPAWDGIGQFSSDDRAEVRISDKVGIIDSEGKRIIDCDYKSISSFTGGFYLVSRTVSGKTKEGITDIDGNVIINCNWDRIQPFMNGLFLVMTEKERKYQYGLYNQFGDMITEAQWLSIENFTGDLLKVQNTERLWSIMNIDGVMVSEDKWKQIGDLFEKTAMVQDRSGYGFINENGLVFVEPQYYKALPFSEGLAAVKTVSGWGYIDKSNTFVINPVYDDVTSFNNNIAEVYQKNRGWNVIDAHGNLVYFIDEKTKTDYQEAVNLLDNQKYSSAYKILSGMLGYEDARTLAEEAKLKADQQLIDDKERSNEFSSSYEAVMFTGCAVQEKPSSSSKIICFVDKGVAVTVMGEPEGSYIQIQLEDGSVGYVKTENIE